MERLILSNLLELKNMHKSFGGVSAVNGCSFEVQQGNIVALIGPNGSGKTTIFNLISGILAADSGTIVLDNVNITDFSIDKRAKMGVSRLFQQSRLFPNLTVEENLLIAMDLRNFNLFSRLEASHEQTKKIIEILDLFELRKKLHVQAKTLSFGQRRLIEIARAYLLPHKILLLDEPLAGVTPRLRDEIAKFLIKLKEKSETIFIIEHDMNFVLNLADEIIVMDAGKIIADGTPNKIKNDKIVIEAYLGEL